MEELKNRVTDMTVLHYLLVIKVEEVTPLPVLDPLGVVFRRLQISRHDGAQSVF